MELSHVPGLRNDEADALSSICLLVESAVLQQFQDQSRVNIAAQDLFKPWNKLLCRKQTLQSGV